MIIHGIAVYPFIRKIRYEKKLLSFREIRHQLRGLPIDSLR